jgi:hypothetical protein
VCKRLKYGNIYSREWSLSPSRQKPLPQSRRRCPRDRRRPKPPFLLPIGSDQAGVWEPWAYLPPSYILSQAVDLALIQSRAPASVSKPSICGCIPLGSVRRTHHPVPAFNSAGSNFVFVLWVATLSMWGRTVNDARTKFHRPATYDSPRSQARRRPSRHRKAARSGRAAAGSLCRAELDRAAIIDHLIRLFGRPAAARGEEAGGRGEAPARR